MSTVIENSSVEQIRAAVDNVRANNSSRPGRQALMLLLDAPAHTLSHDELEAQVGNGLTWHFGWLCKRVAEKLGDSDPATYALTDRSKAKDGKVRLTLKPQVVAALRL